MNHPQESSLRGWSLVIVGIVTVLVLIAGALAIVPLIADRATQKDRTTPLVTPHPSRTLPPEIAFTASDYPCSTTLTAIYRQNVELDSMNQSVVPDTSYCLSAKKAIDQLPSSKRVSTLLNAYCTKGDNPAQQLALDHIYGSLYGMLKMTYEDWAGYTLVDWNRSTTSTTKVYMDKSWGIPSLRPLAKIKCPSATTHPTE